MLKVVLEQAVKSDSHPVSTLLAVIGSFQGPVSRSRSEAITSGGRDWRAVTQTVLDTSTIIAIAALFAKRTSLPCGQLPLR
jgi:hypothetical protein